jgi:hypothetical protein
VAGILEVIMVSKLLNDTYEYWYKRLAPEKRYLLAITHVENSFPIKNQWGDFVSKEGTGAVQKNAATPEPDRTFPFRWVDSLIQVKLSSYMNKKNRVKYG